MTTVGLDTLERQVMIPELAMEKGDFTRASQLYERRGWGWGNWASVGSNWSNFVAAADCALWSGDKGRADELYDRVIKEEERDSSRWSNEGERNFSPYNSSGESALLLTLRKGDVNKALQLFEKSLQAMREHDRARLMEEAGRGEAWFMWKALLALSKGENEQAVEEVAAYRPIEAAQLAFSVGMRDRGIEILRGESPMGTRYANSEYWRMYAAKLEQQPNSQTGQP